MSFAFCYPDRAGSHVCRSRSRNVTVDAAKISATRAAFQSSRIDLKAYPEALPHPSTLRNSNGGAPSDR
jgi:hypothetical protein